MVRKTYVPYRTEGLQTEEKYSVINFLVTDTDVQLLGINVKAQKRTSIKSMKIIKSMESIKFGWKVMETSLCPLWCLFWR